MELDLLVLLKEFEAAASTNETDQNIQRSKYQRRSKPSVFLSVQLVTREKDQLLVDPMLSEQSKQALEKTRDSDLYEAAKWLDGCLSDRRLLLEAVKEKVWAAFHQELLSHLPALVDLTGSRPASSTLCLRLMMALVDGNYKRQTSVLPTDNDLTERDEEIVEYIAGFLLKKLKPRPEALFLVEETKETTGLIAVKSRGGLVQPKEEFTSVLVEMERVFRSMPPTSVDRDLFHDTLCGKDIHSSFFDLLGDIDVDFESKEKFYVDVCNLFFSVRAHQKCRHIVDRYTKERHTTRKTKALRESI